MNPVIQAEDISKRYYIGTSKSPASGGTLRDSLTAFAKAPLRRIRRNGHGKTEAFWALKDVSFEVNEGEIIGIIGRNGAGKSTLLKILARITEPTSGRIELHGRVGSLLEVGTGFHPELTGRENIFLNGAIIGMRREEITRKFDEIVAFSEIERFIDTPVKHYSSGMYTRLAFAVAAHLDPEILLVDEVLAVGDLAFQKKCVAKMSDVTEKGRTVVFVSHNMEAIRKICSRAIFLNGGEIVARGATEEVIAKYVSEGASSQSTYEFPRPGPDENPPGYAYRLTVEDGEGRPAARVPVGSPWQVRVSFEIVRPVEHFIIAIGLTTNLNAPLRTSWTEPQDITPGHYEAIFREDTILLGSGRYSIALGLSSFERSFHYLQDAGVINIANFAEGVELVRIANHGYILNPLKTEIRKI